MTAVQMTAVPTAAVPTAAESCDPMSIQFRHVSKRYRDNQALNGVSFASAGTESIAIVGVNGAGKSTLLRCLLDFTRPDQGEISIAGVCHREPRARAAIAYLPERFVAPAHFSGNESLKYLADLQGLRFDAALMSHTLSRFDFPLDALRKPVRDYSKGMLQKLGLASIVLSRKPWLVLDEPMSGLDPQGRRLLFKLITEARAAGQGLLFTTHGLPGLEQLCDRMVVIHKGRLVFFGTPASLLARHSSDDLEHAFLAEIESNAMGFLQ